LNFPAVVAWTGLGHSRRAGEESLPVISALVLLGAVGFTLVAAYQWAGRLGTFDVASRELAVRNSRPRLARPRLEHRTRHPPLAGLVLRLGNIHAPRRSPEVRGVLPRVIGAALQIPSEFGAANEEKHMFHQIPGNRPDVKEDNRGGSIKRFGGC
jgi:hypothetical protein